MLYYFNKNVDNNGFHEVHSEECIYVNCKNLEEIGDFENCKDAIQAARFEHPLENFDGCFFYCKECHHV